MKPKLTDLETLARGAGEILRAGYPSRPGYSNDLQIHYKSTIDLVTRFDHDSESYLLEEIRRRFPDDQILSEESGSLGGGKQGGLWVIDPLDGTVNFSHGIPIFGVSIAYVQEDQINLGVVYDPMRDEMFSAERGKGAFLNDLPVRVSPVEDLDRSLLVTGFPYDIRTRSDTNLEEYARLALLSQGVRRLGAAAIDLCYVACGRFDGYWELMLNPWDLAAGALIAQEAGAWVTTVEGETGLLTGAPSVIAANPRLYEKLLRVLRPTG